MKDYSIENKVRLLKEIGYFPINNFCNLTGVEKDIRNLKEHGIDVKYDTYHIKSEREIKNFFRFGAYMQHYSTIVFPIARYYLAIEKEESDIDYSFEDYIKINLRDTLAKYKKLIEHKDIKVNNTYEEKRKKIVIEKAYKVKFLNTEIAESRKEIILDNIKKLIKKYYPDFDINIFEDEYEFDGLNTKIIYDYLIDNIEIGNGSFINLLTDDVETGKYYKIDECVEYDEDLYNSGYPKEYFDEFMKNERENLEIIKNKIQKIIQENDVDEEEVEYIDYIEKSVYSDEEVINFIKKHPIFDRECLSKFYKNISEERIEYLINYYNNKIWDSYSKDKEEYGYYYYFFDKHLERKSL